MMDNQGIVWLLLILGALIGVVLVLRALGVE
jgi:hypothetical protein